MIPIAIIRNILGDRVVAVGFHGGNVEEKLVRRHALPRFIDNLIMHNLDFFVRQRACFVKHDRCHLQMGDVENKATQSK